MAKQEESNSGIKILAVMLKICPLKMLLLITRIGFVEIKAQKGEKKK